MEEKVEKEERHVVEKYTIEPVAMKDRKSWLDVAWIWAGTIICVPTIMGGGAIMLGLPFSQALMVWGIGAAVMMTWQAFSSWPGADHGMPVDMIARNAFGEWGSRIVISSLLLIGFLGWFGVMTAVGATAFSTALDIQWGWKLPIAAGAGIWGSVFIVCAAFGFDWMKWINRVAVPALLGLCGYALWFIVTQVGFGKVLTFAPPTPFTLFMGINLAIGMWALGSVVGPNFSRYNKSRGDVMKSTYIGMIPAFMFIGFIGMVAVGATGELDIVVALSAMGVPLVALVLLVVGVWTTAMTNAYASGLSLCNISNLRTPRWRAIFSIIAGSAGIGVAMSGILAKFVGFLMLLAVVYTPFIGVMLADYFLIHHTKWVDRRGANPVALASMGIGIAIAAAFPNFFVPALNGLWVAFAAHLLLTKAFNGVLPERFKWLPKAA